MSENAFNPLKPMGISRRAQDIRIGLLQQFAILTAPKEGASLRDLLRQAEFNLTFLERKLQTSPPEISAAVAIDPAIMHGNPVFRGTRIPLYQIIDELADGTPIDRLAEAYPSLTLDQIQRGLDFASSVLRIHDE